MHVVLTNGIDNCRAAFLVLWQLVDEYAVTVGFELATWSYRGTPGSRSNSSLPVSMPGSVRLLRPEFFNPRAQPLLQQHFNSCLFVLLFHLLDRIAGIV